MIFYYFCLVSSFNLFPLGVAYFIEYKEGRIISAIAAIIGFWSSCPILLPSFYSYKSDAPYDYYLSQANCQKFLPLAIFLIWIGIFVLFSVMIRKRKGVLKERPVFRFITGITFPILIVLMGMGILVTLNIILYPIF